MKLVRESLNERASDAALTPFTSTDDLCDLLTKNPGLKIMIVADNQMYHYLAGGEENGYFVIREQAEEVEESGVSGMDL